MAVKVSQKSKIINLPVSLDQFAAGLRNLSRSDLLTLEVLLDKTAMKTIGQSLRDVKKGKLKEFRA